MFMLGYLYIYFLTSESSVRHYRQYGRDYKGEIREKCSVRHDLDYCNYSK